LKLTVVKDNTFTTSRTFKHLSEGHLHKYNTRPADKTNNPQGNPLYKSLYVIIPDVNCSNENLTTIVLKGILLIPSPFFKSNYRQLVLDHKHISPSAWKNSLVHFIKHFCTPGPPIAETALSFILFFPFPFQRYLTPY